MKREEDSRKKNMIKILLLQRPKMLFLPPRKLNKLLNQRVKSLKLKPLRKLPKMLLLLLKQINKPYLMLRMH